MAKLPVWFDSTSFRKEEDNPILQSQPLKIERYPYARFPSIITLDEVSST